MTQHTFAMDVGWLSFLAQLGVRPVDVLRRAGLPDDLLSQPNARLDSASYFRFWNALEAITASDAGPIALRLFSQMRGESFSPPLFAALCSPDLLTALERLSKYKALVGPQRLEVNTTAREVSVEFVWLDTQTPPPDSLVAAELAFLVCLARMGTREHITALKVTSPRPPPDPTRAYETFLGVAIRKGRGSTVTFSVEDARRPFLSSNDALWAVFEPELRRRVAELESTASTAERVRATLLEALPAGTATMADVAKRLAMSTRTLQRRLETERTSFQQLLRETRESLAMHYLQRTNISSAEISFLLGFEEPNSFFRAFSDWTGKTPESVRRSATAN